MNGDCKSYRLNDPMTKEEFQAMPTDLKITYIKAIRNKYGIPDTHLAHAFGFSQQTFAKLVKKLGICGGKAAGGNRKWDKEGFYAWWNGVEQISAPAIEEIPVEEPTQAEPEAYVEDDLPFEEPEANVDEDIPCIELYQNQGEAAFGSIRPNYAELEAELEKAKAENAWLRNEYDHQRMNVRILEAQMEVVRLIFGGNRNGT